MGNDALQTLGPFLASQRWRSSRLGQGVFLGAVLCLAECAEEGCAKECSCRRWQTESKRHGPVNLVAHDPHLEE